MGLKSIEFELDGVIVKMAIVALLTAGWTSQYFSWKSAQLEKGFRLAPAATSESVMPQVHTGVVPGAIDQNLSTDRVSVTTSPAAQIGVEDSSSVETAVGIFAKSKSTEDVLAILRERLGDDAISVEAAITPNIFWVDGWKLLITQGRVRMSRERSLLLGAAVAKLRQFKKQVNIAVESTADVPAEQLIKFHGYWQVYYNKSIESHVLGSGSNVLRLKVEVLP